MMMETYLRRGQRGLQRVLLDPRVRGAGAVLAYGGGGFLFSAASLGNYAQPLAMGLITAATGWRALVICLGALAGYPFFWGRGGLQGVVWSAAAVLLALLLGKREESQDQPLMIPALGAFLTAVTGLTFQILLRDTTPAAVFFLRVALTFFSSALFTQAARCRDAITDWLTAGLGVLALAQVAPAPGLNLGYVAAGMLGMAAAFPGAALAGLGLDLARIAPVPMTAVMCMAYFIRIIPFDRRWQRCLAPAAAYAIVMAVWGVWDMGPVPALLLGGGLGYFLPPRQEVAHRRGQTGAAQVRLELGAEVMRTTQQLILETRSIPIDQQALVDRAAEQACAGCSARRNCTQRQQMTPALLEHPLDAACRKPGRLIPQLHRAQDQLRTLQADRQRQREYRYALAQQYRFLAEYLRSLSDQLPRRPSRSQPEFRVEVSARSRGKERANGDRCLAFSGPELRYFVLLCDGMGTGIGAAQESQWTGNLVQKLLSAGFPPEHTLRSVNSLLALRGEAGAVTLDLAEIRLDTGMAAIYKWGAAPSYLLRPGGSEKIGTATPPPGISVDKTRETVEKLSLRRGEVLILLSDGVDGEGALRRFSLPPDAPPGELAAEILEKGCPDPEDDATAAVIRLYPASLATS